MIRNLSALSLLLSSTAGFAQSVPLPIDEIDAASGEAIIVTATRTETSTDEIPSAITVVDKGTLDRTQDIAATEAIARTPSISITRNGGYGTATSLRIRGAETDHTVVVIDGVKINDPSSTAGGYNFANLIIGDIERIEVLRGQQSTLWGSQAIGGVVNVVTASPIEPLEGSFDIEAGSRRTVNARAALGGKTGPVTWRLGGQTFTTRGISSIAPAFGGEEADGYTNQTVSGRVNVALAEHVSVDLRGYYSNGRNDFDAFNGDSSEYGRTQEFLGYAGLNVGLSDGRFQNRIAFGYTDTDRENYDPRLERQLTFDAAGRNQRIEYQGTFKFNDQVTALFGYENERSRFRSASPAGSLSIPLPEPVRGRSETNSFYGQLSVKPVSGLTLTGGVRHDDHNRYGGETLFSAGAVWVLPSDTILRAYYGEGFKAPTLFQLYSEYGNTSLGSERAHGWEAGVQQRFFGGLASVGATYFDRASKDLIAYIGCDFGTTDPLCVIPGTTTERWGYYDNISRARARGVEATASLDLGVLMFDANYSWVLSEDRSHGSSTYGNWLPRRARNMANATVSYQWQAGTSVSAAVRWTGKSYDNLTNSRVLDGYTLVDLRASHPISRNVELLGRVENLFNDHYMTAYRYNAMGRSFYAGIRGRF